MNFDHKENDHTNPQIKPFYQGQNVMRKTCL